MLLTEQPKKSKFTRVQLSRPAGAEGWPPHAELIVSAIEAGRHGRQERRRADRSVYRVQATLQLFSDEPGTPPWMLYTRDVSPKGLGFITPHRLTLGHGGLLEIALPNGQVRTIACTLLRCREAAPGWFEGSVYFNRYQADFGE